MIISGGKSVKNCQKCFKKTTNWTYNAVFKKTGISPICGFFQNFLALFDTFTTRYNHSDIKFEFSGYFYPYQRFIQKSFLKMNQKCTSDLCALAGRCYGRNLEDGLGFRKKSSLEQTLWCAQFFFFPVAS